MCQNMQAALASRPSIVGRRAAPATLTSFLMLAATLWVVLSPGAGRAEQVFLLDFDSLYTGAADDHDYTLAERDQITNEMNALLARLGMSATQTLPAAGPYSTVFFNGTAAGTSDGVDFRNVKKSDNAEINAKKMLEIVGLEPGEMTSDRIVRASVNIGIHEALHLLGVRHQDAYTMPGTGLPTAGLAASYSPVYPGPSSASLTSRTFASLAAGAFGLSAEKVLADNLFISPRSAVKALVGEAVPVTEQVFGNRLPMFSQPVAMTPFELPNTLPDDLPLPPGIDPSDLEFTALAAVITGTITQAEVDDPLFPSHYFHIPTIPGARYTIEVFSDVLDHRQNFTPFNAALSVVDPVEVAVADYYGTAAVNHHGIEGSDPAIIDLIAPGESMLVEVWSRTGLEAGDYELIVYTIAVVPEPSTLALLAAGLIAAIPCGLRRFRNGRRRSAGAAHAAENELG